MIGEDTAVPNHENENKTSPAHESPEHKAAVDKREKDGSDSEADGAEEILEESPCKRWSKRREKVKQRDVPGIDAAYLAMDNETGMWLVWRNKYLSDLQETRWCGTRSNSRRGKTSENRRYVFLWTVGTFTIVYCTTPLGEAQIGLQQSLPAHPR